VAELARDDDQPDRMTDTATKSVMPAWMPGLNRRIFNPVQRLWAPYLPPYAIMVHTGRRTGTVYRTPVMAFVKDDTLAITLPYGSETQWVKNVIAADGATIIRRGRQLTAREPRIVTDPEPGTLPRIAAAASRHLGVLVLRVD
jgi:deazaflavin-dependent oxidoreductase (nitroreductase family)